MSVPPNALHNRIKVRLMLRGVDPAAIEAADSEDALLALITEAVLWENEPTITLAEVAERAGIDVDLCRRARMLLGLPDPGDEPLCRVAEVDAFVALAGGVEMFGEEPLLQFTRVMGSALGNLAEGALSVFSRALEDRGEDEALAGDEYVLAAFDALETFRFVPDILRIVTTLQFEKATERLTVNPGERLVAAIGFVDLIASTRTTEDLGPTAMNEALTRFETRAVELAVASGGRVVKFIGDEVMFMAPDLGRAVTVASELVRHVSGDPDLRAARAGVAFGSAVSRDGDWYGTVVNTAARLVEKAAGGSVLFSGEGADDVEGADAKGRRRLRGLPDRVPIWRVDA